MAKLPVPLRAKQRNYYDARSYRPNRRTFSAETKRLAWKRCKRRCEGCTAPVTGAGDIVFDHIVPWALSRDSSLSNAQILCLSCDDDKTAGRDIPMIAKADRQSDFHLGIKGPGRGRCPMPCGKRSTRSKTMRGKVVLRLTQGEKHRATMAALYGSEA